jgi:hypothetical protein
MLPCAALRCVCVCVCVWVDVCVGLPGCVSVSLSRGGLPGSLVTIPLPFSRAMGRHRDSKCAPLFFLPGTLQYLVGANALAWMWSIAWLFIILGYTTNHNSAVGNSMIGKITLVSPDLCQRRLNN